MGMAVRTPRIGAWALGVLVLWTLVYQGNVLLSVAPEHGLLLGRPAHLIVEFSAGFLCAAGALRHRGAVRVAWLLIAAGIVAGVGGDPYWTAVLLDEDSIPVPSLADLGYLLFPLLTFTGLVLLLRARTRSTSRRLLLDPPAATPRRRLAVAPARPGGRRGRGRRPRREHGRRLALGRHERRLPAHRPR